MLKYINQPAISTFITLYQKLIDTGLPIHTLKDHELNRKENQDHVNNQLVKSTCACVSIFTFINNVHTHTHNLILSLFFVLGLYSS